MATPTQQRCVNGDDMLLYIGGKAVGHCTTHTVTLDIETKERAFKPLSSAARTFSTWKHKGVTGMSVSITAEGLCFYDETENGYAACAALATAGQSVAVKCCMRDDSTPYLEGNFVITKLDRTDPSQDDATYSINLENDGEVSFKNLTTDLDVDDDARPPYTPATPS